MTKFIIFEGNHEILITTQENEISFIKEYFSESDRNIEEYDRNIISGFGVQLTANIKIR